MDDKYPLKGSGAKIIEELAVSERKQSFETERMKAKEVRSQRRRGRIDAKKVWLLKRESAKR